MMKISTEFILKLGGEAAWSVQIIVEIKFHFLVGYSSLVGQELTIMAIVLGMILLIQFAKNVINQKVK